MSFLIFSPWCSLLIRAVNICANQCCGSRSINFELQIQALTIYLRFKEAQEVSSIFIIFIGLIRYLFDNFFIGRKAQKYPVWIRIWPKPKEIFTGSADIDSRFFVAGAGVGKRSAWWRACCRGSKAEINIYGSADIDSRFLGAGKRSAWWQACCRGGESK